MDTITASLENAARHFREGRLAEADAICAALTGGDAASVGALTLHAAVRSGQGRLADAIGFLTRAAAVAPGQPQVHFNLGVLRQQSGDLAGAARDYEAACRCDAAYLPAWINLGHLRLADDDPLAAEQAFRSALAAAPSNAMASEGLGAALLRQQRNDEAAQAFRSALAAEPGNPALHMQLGVALHSRGDAAAAAECYRRALAIDPAAPECHALLSTALYDLGDLAAALAENDRALASGAGRTRALMMRALILAESGDTAGARRLQDLDRLLARRSPSFPGGAGPGELLERVAAEIRAHPSLVANRPNKTTRNGAQTGELFEHATPGLAALRDIIVREIETYIAGIGAEGAGHPFTAAAPRAWRLRAWATLLRDGGYQDPHYHPTGWLSGVIYIEVPAVVASGRDGAGFIEFGRPDPRYKFSFVPETVLIEPRPGEMILFPSYFWHRTVPFASGEERISVAFDVIPAS